MAPRSLLLVDAGSEGSWEQVGHHQLPVDSHAGSENVPLHPVSKQPPRAAQEQSINDQVEALPANNCTLQREVCQNMPGGFIRGSRGAPSPGTFPPHLSSLAFSTHSPSSLKGWAELGHPQGPHSFHLFPTKPRDPAVTQVMNATLPDPSSRLLWWRFEIRAASDTQSMLWEW